MRRRAEAVQGDSGSFYLIQDISTQFTANREAAASYARAPRLTQFTAAIMK
jgi:hypothetical protein